MIMYPIPWYVALLVSVPESLLVILIGSRLYDIHIQIRAAIIIALIMGVIAYLVRLFPLPFGMHTIIQFAVLVLLINLVAAVKWPPAVISALTGLVIIGIFESMLMPFFLMFTGTTIHDFVLQPWLNVLSFLPLAGMLILFYLLISRFKFTIYQL